MTKESRPTPTIENKPLRSRKEKRLKMFSYLLGVIIFLSVTYGAYWFFYSSHYVSTDNAYVGAEVAEVTSLVDGVVGHIYVTDTQHVKEGDVLVIIADHDAKLALRQAEAKCAQAGIDLKRTEQDYKRRKALAASGSVSAEELSNTENAFKIAEAVFQEARAFKELAQLNETRTRLCAPISGVVARRQVQLGQRVMPGMRLLSIVPLTDVYVNANFKENELRDIKPGQRVLLTSDKYGSGVEFHGQVEGFSGGTGSAFALIPAQNATGNWVKVVQRLPVRIALKAEELAKDPLEVGLSMHVSIDISSNSSSSSKGE